MKFRNIIVAAVASAALIGLARADWDDGMDYKMLKPQLPNPEGWDVGTLPGMGPVVPIADDWQCTETGPVTDIHIWYSWQGMALAGELGPVQLTIWGDVPAVYDPSGVLLEPSHPDGGPADFLWQGLFTSTQYKIRPWYQSGPQGFIFTDPAGLNYLFPPDHYEFYQLNVTGILNPFVQEADTIYWLGVQFTEPLNGSPGWKTSITQWNDDAVWWGPDPLDPTQWMWRPLEDPSHVSLDMAFVITTPEPQTYALIAGLGLVGFAAVRRFLRK